ncbi:MAG: hypothetical protein ABI378_08020 [Chitinophagaceae bacterium]
MLTINTILKEIKEVPLNRLEELYQFVHSLTPKAKTSDKTCQKILSFGGAFKDLSENDYADFVENTKKSRAGLFNRDIEL